MSGSVPASWAALQRITEDLLTVGVAAPGSDHPLAQWTTRDAVLAYHAITTRHAKLCAERGWDVDLLEDPHPQLVLTRSHQYPHAIDVTGNYFPPDVTAPLLSAGAQFTSEQHAWVPLSPNILTPLREAVRLGSITVSTDARTQLQTLNQYAPEPVARFSEDGSRLLLFTPPDRRGLWQAIPGSRWVDKYRAHTAALIHAPAVVAIAEEEKLPVSVEVAALARRACQPFDYDRTLDGLRDVPIGELVCLDDAVTARFTKLGISSIYDLLTWVPLRYLDRSVRTPVSSARVGEYTAVQATVAQVDTFTRPRRTKMLIRDDTGTLDVTFFNSTWQARRFRTGTQVLVAGVVSEWRGNGRRRLQMTNPVIDSWEDNADPFLPIYPQSETANISTWNILSAVREALARLGRLIDPLPSDIQQRHGLIPRQDALTRVHFPRTSDDIAAARRRIAFDELFRLQASLQYARLQHAQQPSLALTTAGPIVTGFINQLPFTLTPEQQHAWQEISGDISRTHPMHRLLQGDVGSGKTMIAALTTAAAIDTGAQAAVMAPTEILATQLWQELSTRLGGFTTPDGTPVRVELLTNKQRGKKRAALIAAIAAGDVHITVGTHALLDESVQFANLAAIVVDEQHRFGVEQRAVLRDKPSNGNIPHTLVMTATPIPRTAAMTIFGDLDISTITALPPGRQPIRTHWLNTPVDVLDSSQEPWVTIREAVRSGHQAYVVCPLVADSERLQAANAEETHATLSANALAGLRVGLVHGQQKPDVRESTMRQFADGQVDVLVSTTVIEVGVNVPNATVIAILDPARFGIAQLHQLRGRVGRGDAASECFLVGETSTAEGQERLRALTMSTDGFHLAEVDLSIRGPGSLLGAAQSGTGKWVVADLSTDTLVLQQAQQDVAVLLRQDPTLEQFPALQREIHRTLDSDVLRWLNRS